jgi:hypothetical protein
MSMVNNPAVWANQISALTVQRSAQASAASTPLGGQSGTSAADSLFADLVANLTGGAVTVNSSAASTSPAAATSTTTAPGAASPGQIAQDVKAFTQSLSQVLASQPSVPAQTLGTAAITAPHGHAHAHHHGGERTSLESLLSTLNNSGASATTSTSSSASSTDLANLNSTFSKLMSDLGSSGASAQSRSALPGLLQSVLQHVQQQGAWAASSGHAVHAVA